MKILLTALAAVTLIGAVATATPAEARCWWNGYNWQCASRSHNGYDSWRYSHRRNGGWNNGWNGGGYNGGWNNGGGYNGGWHNGGGYNR
jgi:hypothetical protein